MNWMKYPVFEWPNLITSVAAYSKKVPAYFAPFIQTKDLRLENIREFLTAHGLELHSGFPNWIEVGDWLIKNIDGPVAAFSDTDSPTEYELRWRSLCCDLGTLFGEQLMMLFPGCFWEYYVGSKREIGANEVVVSAPDHQAHLRFFALSCIAGSRARIARLKFPTTALVAAVSRADLLRELEEERSSIAKYFELCFRDLSSPAPHDGLDSSDNPFPRESYAWQKYAEAQMLPGVGCLLIESQDDDNNGKLEWVRVVPNVEQRGVSLETDSTMGYWVLWTNLSEQLRDDLLYEELQKGIEAVLREIRGITLFIPEDREIWHVYGDFDESALISAVGDVVDDINMLSSNEYES